MYTCTQVTFDVTFRCAPAPRSSDDYLDVWLLQDLTAASSPGAWSAVATGIVCPVANQVRVLLACVACVCACARAAPG